jgi:hypothetical protein
MISKINCLVKLYRVHAYDNNGKLVYPSMCPNYKFLIVKPLEYEEIPINMGIYNRWCPLSIIKYMVNEIYKEKYTIFRITLDREKYWSKINRFSIDTYLRNRSDDMKDKFDFTFEIYIE